MSGHNHDTPHAPGGQSAVRFTRKLLVFGYGYLLLFLFRDGAVNLYLSERFHFVLVAGAVMMILASMTYSTAGGPGHHHARSPVRQWFGLVILAVPLALALLSPPAVLGAHNQKGRDFMLFGGQGGDFPDDILSKAGPGAVKIEITSEDGKTETHRYTQINLMELGTVLQGSGDTYVGDRVSVRGFVYHDKRAGENRFFLARYYIVCCVVHAAPVSIVVDPDGAGPFKTDTWITVHGVIEPKEKTAKDDLPFLIKADKIETTGVPRTPYMSRWSRERPFLF